jgi:membrane protease YdiL (CAAX protease family)
MSENEPIVPPRADALPSTDVQLAPESGDGAAAPPNLGLPARSLVQEPRWPHPSFGWALLWCLLFTIVTQLPGAVIAGVVAVVLSLVARERFPLDTSSPEKLYKSDAMNIGLAVAFYVTEILVVGFSWLIIRLVVGRDWARQLAVRHPSLIHTLLALASFPVLALMGNVVYELLKASRWVPSISKANPLDVVNFWAAVFAVLGVAVLVSWLVAGFGWTRKLAARPTQPADILIVAAVLPLLLGSIAAVYEGLHWTIQVPGLESLRLGGMEEMTELFGSWPLVFAVLVIGVGPGIGEELWCRGFLGRGLVGSHGAVLGVLGSSFCFGLIHVDPCQGTMAMVMGLWLHFVYLSTRSLLLPMLLHFLNNSMAVLGTRLPQLDFLDAKPAAIPATVYVSSGLLVAALIYALYQSRPRLEPAALDQPLFWRPPWQGVECPPPGGGARLTHPAPSFLAMSLAVASFVLFAAACAVWIQGR